MKNYWLGWNHLKKFGAFELHSPWWVSGSGDHGEQEYCTICAAIRATDVFAAQETVIASYDKRPEVVVWRFYIEQPDDWSPFSDRFPKADWMDEYWTDESRLSTMRRNLTLAGWVCFYDNDSWKAPYAKSDMSIQDTITAHRDLVKRMMDIELFQGVAKIYDPDIFKALSFWFCPHQLLDGASPFEALATGDGPVRVERILNGIEYGLPV